MSAPRILLCGLNWLGDTIMALPAVQALRAAEPAADLAVLVKPALAALWRMHAAPGRVLTYTDTHAGTWRAGLALRAERFDRCFVLPNSFRSALLARLAGVPERVGRTAGYRDLLLTRVLPASDPARHQQYEYFDLLAPAQAGRPAGPRLTPPPEAVAQAAAWLDAAPRPRVAVLPGAARGGSKRWPAERFAEVGRRLREGHGATLVTLGSASERPLAQAVAGAAGGAIELCGRTSLPELAAVLQACDLVLCNDSGGMHLASALGAPLVAVFGLTDPARTGPLGPHAVVLQAAGRRLRDVPRESEEAQKALAAVSAAQVYEAARQLLGT